MEQKNIFIKYRGNKSYDSWRLMIYRCKNKKCKQYNDYGGRGIDVCDSWLDFRNFATDMGYPDKGMMLDRIDNEKGYSKENCKWSNRSEQLRNTRRNFYVYIDGKKYALVDACALYGMSRHVVRRRLKDGWNLMDALTMPLWTRKIYL